MSLKIEMPGGEQYNPDAGEQPMCGVNGISDREMRERAKGIAAAVVRHGVELPVARNVAIVATELEDAIKMHAALPERIKSLRTELDGLLGKKLRGPRKTGA